MGQTSADSPSLGVLVLEPYYGGSHRAFLDGWAAASRHRFHLVTMPARKWKWRMRGSALWCTERLAEAGAGGQFDLILTSDMMPVADLRALLPRGLARRPVVCYFHENQLTYPLSPEDRRDYQYGFTNLSSCLAADEVWFNSAYHLTTYLRAIDELLREMPDCVPVGLAKKIEARARVMHPGMDLRGLDQRLRTGPSDPPVILWNHRWEYDKGPDTFFRVLSSLSAEGIPFRLIVAGQHFRSRPAVFDQARARLADHIDHLGYYPSRGDYLKALGSADYVVSTAIHEFFGLAVMEAVAAGCFPILPDRLSYPELIPPDLHPLVLYGQDGELQMRLRGMLRSPPSEQARQAAVDHARRFAWERRAAEFDDGLAQALRRRQD